jgi:phage tail-like protein
MPIDSARRGHVEDLPSPRPIANELPATLQDDDFCLRLVAAFDEVLAPLFATLDCWDSYLDARLAPADFVDWLASWVGIDIDETWSLERRRRLITEAVDLYRIRGTAAGLAAHIGLYAGVTPEIDESGGCAWSETVGTAFPGSADPHLTVLLRLHGPDAVNRTTINRIVDASRPAHLPYRLEIISGEDAASGAGDRWTSDEAGNRQGTDDDRPGAVPVPGSEGLELEPPGPTSYRDADDHPQSSPPEGKETE